GKTSSGWSIGLLYALTGDENRRYLDDSGEPARALVEPQTHYFTGNLRREFRQGQSTFGGMLTAVDRNVSNDRAADALHSSAYTGGVDVVHEWANRSWALGGFLAGSYVEGSQSAILQTQRSPSRYFQRPDSDRFSVDQDAGSMGGLAGT